MLFLVAPPTFSSTGERTGPAILRTTTGEREEWHPIVLNQVALDCETGDVLDNGWKAWIGPYGHVLSDNTLLALAAPGYGGSHTGCVVAPM